MGPRHRAREVALRVLFQIESSPTEWRSVLAYHLEEDGLAAEPAKFAEVLVGGVVVHLKEIDSRIAEASSNWRMDQIGALERAVLRLGCEELVWQRTEPVAVVIDEAIRLAKELAGPDAGRFVNGVLGRLARVTETDERGKAGAGAGPNSAGR